MVPESPSVCFRCKMCKVCFLTMNDIERHLKTTNHFIRPSSNTNSTKENSTASESSDDKPLNLSSKSAFPPLPTPTRPNDIDLKLSSEDFENDDDKIVKGKNALKDAVKLKEVKSAAAVEIIALPKAGFSRKASAEADSLLTENSVCTKSTTQDDLADVETDTVSSTSSEHPPPSSEKNIETPPPLETGEADVSTQFPLLGEEEKSYETCSTTTQNCEKSVDRGKQRKVGKPLVVGEMVKNKETFPTAQQCDGDDDEETQKMEDAPMDVDENKEKTSVVVTNNTPSLKSSSTTVAASSEEKVNQVEHNETSSRIHEDCEMPTNENDEPERQQNEEGQDSKLNPATESPPKNNKQKLKYRCRHCGEMFAFPVQVHTHMRKVHVSARGGGGESTTSKPRRRSTANTPTNNNNNNDTAKPNVQMYPLRSLYARAKRRTRSMQSDGGGSNIRRNSLGHNNNNNEERKEKKSTTSRKIICFSCRHCGKKFPLLNQLKIHLHKVHPEKVKKEAGAPNGGLRNRKHFASNRLLVASKKRRQTTPLLVQTQNRSTRVSTRSASRSADSEPETVRMNTRRRSSAARSEKSCVQSATSSRRSSTRREQDIRGGTFVKREPKMESDEEKNTPTEKTRMKRRYTSSGNSSSTSKKRALVVKEEEEEDELTTDDEGDQEEEKRDVETFDGQLQGGATGEQELNSEDTIYNDSDCMIIDTVETILYALTSKRSQTCPNCNKYCKFAGNFKLHLKACMNLDDDLELITDSGGGQQKTNLVKKDVGDDDEQASGEEMEEGVDEEEDDDDKEEEESESDNESHEGSESSPLPYYQKLDYRRCWECGFIVSKFHNLSRHLKQRHNISMGTKEMHAKQAEILRLK